MTRRAVLLALLVACDTTPDETKETDSEVVEDTELTTESDPPVDTEVVVDTEVTVDTEATVDTAPPAATVLEIGTEVLCTSPSVRSLLGAYTVPTGGGDWATQPYDPNETTLFTAGGITVEDLNGDGMMDLWLPGHERSRLYLQGPNFSFTDVTATHLPGDDSRGVSAIPGDPDGDGDLDIFIASYKGQDRLLRNDGTGHFDSHPWSSDVGGEPDARSANATWGDIDNDGDLDLYVTVYGQMYSSPPAGHPNRLYENTGSGFVDISDRLPPESQTSFTFVAVFQDLNGDHLPELYLDNDHGDREPNLLLWNRGTHFEADDGAMGLNVAIQGMGVYADDIDGDGEIDWAMSSWFANRLMIRTHTGFWLDRHQQLGFRGDAPLGQHVAWGPDGGDLDNDGDLDLVHGYGDIWNQSSPDAQPDEVFLQEDDGTFTPVGSAIGFDHPGQTRGVLAVDMNADGWLDLVRRDLIGPATVQLARCGEDSWLKVHLQQPGNNRLAVGAVVRLRQGDQLWSREVRGGGISVFSARPTTAHFGLGDLDTVETLEVQWPDGAVDTFSDVPTRRDVVVHRSP